MATPLGARYVTFTGDTSTLLVGSAGIRFTGQNGLASVGASRGNDLTYAQQDGADAYPRFRGPTNFAVSLTIRGQWDQDGALVADRNGNAETLRALVAGFPDANDREFDVAWTTFGAEWEAEGRFNRFGDWSNPVPHIWQVDMLVDVPTGLWTAA